MRSGSQTRLLAILLAVVTLGAIGLAIANLVQESSYPAPTDGARWIETEGGLRAYIVPAGSAADKAGIRQGDVLTAIDGVPTTIVATADREMYRTGVWGHATYSVLRQTSDWAKPIAIDIGVILEPTDRTDYQVERLIGLIYLAIGLYVLFRRWTAPKSTHFYVFCLMSFVLYAFKYTGAFDGLDLAVYWANIQAAALQPALFLHFALSFGERRRRDRSGLLYAPLYLPAAVLVLLRFLSLHYWSPTAAPAASSRPSRLRLYGDLLRHRRCGLLGALPPRAAAAAASAAQVALARNAAHGRCPSPSSMSSRSCSAQTPPARWSSSRHSRSSFCR